MFLVEEVQKLDKSARWNYTFQLLNLETRKVVEDFTLKEARLPEHRNLNRYRDVLPYDHSRVELQDGDTNYINGNMVEVVEIGRKYILTQGPLPDTCSHFWQMAWEQRSGAVIMLNKVIEKNAVKCHPYWPMGEDEIHEYGNYTVKNLSERADVAYVVRDLVLQHKPSGESRNIKQFHYMLWPDFGVPSKPKTFLEFLYDIRDSGVFDEGQGPPIIHCSAGIGRSGTFCLVDSILLKAELDGKPDNIDVKDMLLHLRKYRVGLVQTPEQLRFSYLAIIQGIADLYPEIFKINSAEMEESHKRKAEDNEGDGEPPPVPPRKRAPPEKPPRRLEKTETTAAEESLKQKKMVKNLRDGIVDESSDDDASDEEVLDLSASEDERELVELYESDEQNAEIAKTEDQPPPPVPERDFPRKPLPPVPNINSKEDILEPVQKNESHDAQRNETVDGIDIKLRLSENEDETKSHDDGSLKTDNHLLPTFSSEDEDEAEEFLKRHQMNSENDVEASQLTERSNKSEATGSTNISAVEGSASFDNSNEAENQKNKISDADDKAREERELRQRKRRDEKNKHTAEMIQKIKKNMQEKEINAAWNVMYKKSLIAVGISAALLLGYYWAFG